MPPIVEERFELLTTALHFIETNHPKREPGRSLFLEKSKQILCFAIDFSLFSNHCLNNFALILSMMYVQLIFSSTNLVISLRGYGTNLCCCGGNKPADHRRC